MNAGLEWLSTTVCHASGVKGVHVADIETTSSSPASNGPSLTKASLGSLMRFMFSHTRFGARGVHTRALRLTHDRAAAAGCLNAGASLQSDLSPQKVSMDCGQQTR